MKFITYPSWFFATLVPFPAIVPAFFLVLSQIPFQKFKLTSSSLLVLFLIIYLTFQSVFFSGDFLELAELFSFVFIVATLKLMDIQLKPKIILWLLTISTTLFYFQGLIYYMSGEIFDPIAMLLEVESRTLAYRGTVFRPNGLQDEPGTYGSLMGLLLLKIILDNRRLDEIESFLMGYILLSLPLSFSLFALFYFCLCIATLVSRSRIRFGLFIAIIAFSGFLISLIFPFIVERFDVRDPSFIYKLKIMTDLQNFGFIDVLVGRGFDYNNCDCFMKESGYLLNSIFRLGLIYFVLILAVLVSPMKGVVNKFFFGLALCVSKLELIEPTIALLGIGYSYGKK